MKKTLPTPRHDESTLGDPEAAAANLESLRIEVESAMERLLRAARDPSRWSDLRSDLPFRVERIVQLRAQAQAHVDAWLSASGEVGTEMPLEPPAGPPSPHRGAVANQAGD